MLYFVCYVHTGFLRDMRGNCTHSIRNAKPFPTFEEADKIGRENARGQAFAVLSNCTGSSK